MHYRSTMCARKEVETVYIIAFDYGIRLDRLGICTLVAALPHLSLVSVLCRQHRQS
jgi:hypothetical protein